MPMFYGWFKLATNKKVRYKIMWFCHDDKDWCLLGEVQDFVKGKPQVPNAWPIFTSTKFTSIEMASLEEVGFCLPTCAQVEAKCRWQSNFKTWQQNGALCSTWKRSW
jgi:hypothetical protein